MTVPCWCCCTRSRATDGCGSRRRRPLRRPGGGCWCPTCPASASRHCPRATRPFGSWPSPSSAMLEERGHRPVRRSAGCRSGGYVAMELLRARPAMLGRPRAVRHEGHAPTGPEARANRERLAGLRARGRRGSADGSSSRRCCPACWATARARARPEVVERVRGWLGRGGCGSRGLVPARDGRATRTRCRRPRRRGPADPGRLGRGGRAQRSCRAGPDGGCGQRRPPRRRPGGGASGQRGGPGGGLGGDRAVPGRRARPAARRLDSCDGAVRGPAERT